jgi:hypothetical protein
VKARELPNLEDRRALKPVRGDVVRYMTIDYVVTEVGNRWAKAYVKGLGTPEFPELIPLQLVVKTGESV